MVYRFNRGMMALRMSSMPGVGSFLGVLMVGVWEAGGVVLLVIYNLYGLDDFR